MKYLNNLKSNTPCDWLEAAKSSQHKYARHLRRLAEKCIAPRYLDFDQIIYDYTIKPSDSRFKKVGIVFIDLYNNAPKSLNIHLKNRRHEHELDECPYCGNPVIPDTLDHFLPKDDWPEYSIFPNNLVPQCRGCAPIKGTKYFNADKNCALFLHPIYNDLLSKLAFKINVSIENDLPIFEPSFKIKKQSSPEERNRLISHISSLKIKERISKYCHQQYFSWKRRLIAHSFDIEESLNVRIGEFSDTENPKNWESAFIQGVLESKETINHLKSFTSNKLENKNNSDEELTEILM